MPRVTITATMADGTILVEQAADFGRYLDLVLGFRRDPDCRRLTWRVEPRPCQSSRPALVLLAS